MSSSQTINKNEKAKVSEGVLGGALSLTVSAIIVKIIGVIYKVPLSYLLGDEGMGYFNSAYTVFGFFYLICTAGVPKAVMLLVSEQKSGDGGGERIVRIAMRAFLILGIIISSAFMIFSAPIAALVGNSQSAYTMLAVAPSIIFISLGGVVRGYLSAHLELFSVAVSQIIEGVGKLVLGLIFAIFASKASMPLPIVSALTILGVSFGSLFGMLYLLAASHRVMKAEVGISEKKKRKSEPLCDLSESKRTLKKILSISLPITLSAAVMSITGILDLFMIMKRLASIGYTTLEATALYGNYTTLAVPMFNLVLSLISPISVAFLPVFSRAYINNRKNFDKCVNMSLELMAYATAPMCIGLMVYSEEILALIFGREAAEVGAPMLVVLAPGLIFMSAILIVNSALEASGSVRVPVYSMLFGSALKILVSFLLLGNRQYGIIGAPLGTVVCYAAALVFSSAVSVKKLKTTLPFVSKYLLPLLLSLVSVYIAKAVTAPLSETLGNTVGTLLGIGASAFLYIALLMIFGLLGKKKLKEVSKYTKLAGFI